MDQANAQALQIASPAVNPVMSVPAGVLQSSLMRSPVVICPVPVETICIPELASESKVYKEDVTATRIHQDVGGLDVVVAVGAGVQVFKAVQHLQTTIRRITISGAGADIMISGESPATKTAPENQC